MNIILGDMLQISLLLRHTRGKVIYIVSCSTLRNDQDTDLSGTALILGRAITGIQAFV